MLFFAIIISISPNLESISVHKSLEFMDSSSIIENFISDTYFLKSLNLWFKPSSFVPGLIPRPEGMVVPPIFIIDILAGPSKRTHGFFWILTVIKQCSGYSTVYYFHQMRFPCAFTSWKKYVHWHYAHQIL